MTLSKKSNISFSLLSSSHVNDDCFASASFRDDILGVGEGDGEEHGDGEGFGGGEELGDGEGDGEGFGDG